jgi:hypothetical protein
MDLVIPGIVYVFSYYNGVMYYRIFIKQIKGKYGIE